MFRKILCWILRQEPLVEIENSDEHFTTKFDPDTQKFRKVLFYEDTQKFEFKREDEE